MNRNPIKHQRIPASTHRQRPEPNMQEFIYNHILMGYFGSFCFGFSRTSLTIANHPLMIFMAPETARAAPGGSRPRQFPSLRSGGVHPIAYDDEQGRRDLSKPLSITVVPMFPCSRKERDMKKHLFWEEGCRQGEHRAPIDHGNGGNNRQVSDIK